MIETLISTIKSHLPFTSSVSDSYMFLSFLFGLAFVFLLRPRSANSVGVYERLYPQARIDVGANTQASHIASRQKEYKTLVSTFYDLVTDFYEYGWSRSFHFAPRKTNEPFQDSLLRLENVLATSLNIDDNSKVLDVGCGVGGPMRNIHRMTKSDITGVTINQYQVDKGNRYCREERIAEKTRSVIGDFQNLESKFSKNEFDACYEIEATCHSPNKIQTYSQVAHVLKKGGIFAGYEWVVLPSPHGNYDSEKEDDVRIKEGIEVGNGLPTLSTPAEVKDALEKAGFEVLTFEDANIDMHKPGNIPWYSTLAGEYKSISGFRMTPLGRALTHVMVSMLEVVRIAPKGSARVSNILNRTAEDLVEGGQREIFTPSWFFVARKI